jgi:xyloglucan-specific exo-beta-1,4-glucanase
MYYSTNNGSNWKAVTGITFNTRPVADQEIDNRFYAYNNNDGYLYYSTNGTSFSRGAYTGASGGSQHIRTVPGFTGHVWVALYGGGLAYTTNGASASTSFIKINAVTACSAVGIGKAATGASYPAVYIWGTIGGVEGLYRSTNQGVSWTRINDDAHEWGGPGNGQFVVGDMNTYGRVYISTAGRGIVYVESGSVAGAREAVADVITRTDAPVLKLTAYPNPVTSVLTVQLPEELKGGNIYLFNSAGQTVFAGKATNTVLTINMNNMPADTYILKIVSGTRSSLQKIIRK